MLWSGRRAGAVLGAVAVAWIAACGGGSDTQHGFNILANQGGPAQTAVGSQNSPYGVTFDSNGYLYIGSDTGRITRVDQNGVKTVFAETGVRLAGLATGPQNEIFAAAPNEGAVIAVAQNGGKRVATSGLDTPVAITFDPNKFPLVAARGDHGFPAIARIEFDTTFTVLTESVDNPSGLAFGTDGRLYVSDYQHNRIVVMSFDSPAVLTAPEDYAIGITLPEGLVFDAAGHLFVATTDQVWVVDFTASNPIRPFVVSGDIDGPTSLAFGIGPDRDTGTMWIANYGYPLLGSGTTVSNVKIGIPGNPLYAP